MSLGSVGQDRVRFCTKTESVEVLRGPVVFRKISTWLPNLTHNFTELHNHVLIQRKIIAAIVLHEIAARVASTYDDISETGRTSLWRKFM